jgi:hypothetical protein
VDLLIMIEIRKMKSQTNGEVGLERLSTDAGDQLCEEGHRHDPSAGKVWILEREVTVIVMDDRVRCISQS